MQQAMRPRSRSPSSQSQAAHETMPQVSKGGWSPVVGKRQMDRHILQSEVGYLFSGLWRGKEKERRAERQRERDREGVGSCLFEKEKEETQAVRRKEEGLERWLSG